MLLNLTLFGVGLVRLEQICQVVQLVWPGFIGFEDFNDIYLTQ